MAPRTSATSTAAGATGTGTNVSPPALTGVAANMMTMFENLGANHTLADHIVRDHGINTPAELGMLGDEGVALLMRTIRRPGGTVTGGGSSGGATADQGMRVMVKFESIVVMASYMVHHWERTSRTIAPSDITVDLARAWRDRKDMEAGHTKPTTLPKINDSDWPRTVENMVEYFGTCLGVKGVPLAYIVRENVGVPADPDPKERYQSLTEELIMRAPHNDPMYESDNMAVWYLLVEICGDHACTTYIQPARAAKDGRRGFKLLHDHDLGPNNVQHMASQARNKLQNAVYNGEKARWNFEKFIRVHYQQHNVLQGLVPYGYSGLDEPTKVQYLLDGVKTDKLETVKVTIISSASLRSNFANCVTLMQDYIRQDKSNQPKLQIASVKAGTKKGAAKGKNKSSGKGAGNKKRKATSDAVEFVENRCYDSEEYKTLTAPQRNYLRLQREKEKVKVAALSAQVSELSMTSAAEAAVAKVIKAQLKKKKRVTYDSQTERSDSNRSNRALMRQRIAESDTESE